jgi:hypothetical protein
MLKVLACLFMLLDHVGYYFSDFLPYPVYLVLRCVGRLAFPIFAWSVARGCARTHNPLHYFLRMALFALPTEVLIRFLNRLRGIPDYPVNVLITFSLAIVLVFGYQMATRSTRDVIASLRPISPTPNTAPTAPRFDVRINLGGIELDSRLGLALGLLAMLAAIAATAWLMPDYDFYGICTVMLFFVVHERFPEKDHLKRSVQGFLALNLVFLVIHVLSYGISYSIGSVIQVLSVAALPLCYLPQLSRKPSAAAKYAFYAFYPLHITILALLRYLLTFFVVQR